MNVYDKIFKDRSGRIVLGQPPNMPIIVWGVCFVLTKIFAAGQLFAIFSNLASIALVYWAILEMSSGVNFFRRLLGIAVFLITMYGLIN